VNGEQDTRSSQERSGEAGRPGEGEVSHREAPQGHREEGSRSTVESSVTLTPVESSHIAAHGYEEDAQRLKIQFRNGDIWEYSFVPEKYYSGLLYAESPGSFFNQSIKPLFPGTLIHLGSFSERVEIWLRSENTKRNYAGCWVALAMGFPVTVIGYAETEEQARAAAGEGGGDFAVVQVPGHVEANRYDV
jgi:hypothetical protein